jgi:hypothetical protein
MWHHMQSDDLVPNTMNSATFIWNSFHQLYIETQSNEIQASTGTHAQCAP